MATNDDTMIGIDVSRWQGDIDYEKVKADGVEFVISVKLFSLDNATIETINENIKETATAMLAHKETGWCALALLPWE